MRDFRKCFFEIIKKNGSIKKSILKDEVIKAFSEQYPEKSRGKISKKYDLKFDRYKKQKQIKISENDFISIEKEKGVQPEYESAQSDLSPMSVMTDPENVSEHNDDDETQNSIGSPSESYLSYSPTPTSPQESFSSTKNPDAPPRKRKKLNHSRLKLNKLHNIGYIACHKG